MTQLKSAQLWYLNKADTTRKESRASFIRTAEGGPGSALQRLSLTHYNTARSDGALTLINSYQTDFLPFFFSYIRYRVRHASSLNLLVVRSSARACRQGACFLAEEEGTFKGVAIC
jgi:hypothetical protein